MENLLMNEAVGNIAGSAYERRAYRTKDYYAVKIFTMILFSTQIAQARFILP